MVAEKVTQVLIKYLKSDTNHIPISSIGIGLEIWTGWDFDRSEEHTSELQSQSNLVCRLLLEKKKSIQDGWAIPTSSWSLSLSARSLLSPSHLCFHSRYDTPTTPHALLHAHEPLPVPCCVTTV